MRERRGSLVADSLSFVVSPRESLLPIELTPSRDPKRTRHERPPRSSLEPSPPFRALSSPTTVVQVISSALLSPSLVYFRKMSSLAATGAQRLFQPSLILSRLLLIHMEGEFDGELTPVDRTRTSRAAEEVTNGKSVHEKETNGSEEKVVAVEVETKTGISFPVKLDDGKQLSCVGLRKKSMLGIGIKIYSFGMYTENEKLKELLKLKIGKAPENPTKELYQLVIDSDVEMVVRLVIVFSSLTMSMVRKNFEEGLGASIKKLTGGKKNDELANKVMGQASDNIKLTPGSLIEISRLPGFVLEAKVMGEVISKVESELLCRAYINMYLGDDPLDKEAKDKFGMSLISLF